MTNDYGRMHYVTQQPGSTIWTDTPTAFYSHATALAINNADDVFIIGHGHPNNVSCKSMLDMCYIQKNGTTWTNPQLIHIPALTRWMQVFL